MHLHQRFARPAVATGSILVLTLTLAGCSTPPDPKPVSSETTGAEQVAEELVAVTDVHEATGMTLLEGPTFGPDGDLYVVDVTAPPGSPKVLRIDTESTDVTPVFSDESSVYTSAQFSPADGRIYLTDLINGEIDSITAEGDDQKTFFSGEVDGMPMAPDDIAFDEEGNLFVSDTTGYADSTAAPQGRVVRIDAETAEATVLAAELPAPNGISFADDFGGLWVSQYNANRMDYLTLSEDGTAVTAAHPAVHFDGGTTQIDSTAVDADGNIYQAVHGQPTMFVYSPTGELISTVTIPSGTTGLTSVTNVAIDPGTTDAYMTVSGSAGGFVYTFDALGKGIQQSNGG